MLIVCGSGRSGTSAVARMLHCSGISVGHDLIEADEHNAEGYFEERQVVLVNDAILRAVRMHEWFVTASRDEIMAAAQQYRSYMEECVAEATPAWKDPRFCWTLEPWMEVLPERPRVIVCLRSPAEVVASTMRYYGLADDEPRRAVEQTWRGEYERLLEVIDEFGLDAISVEFGALYADPEAAAAPLAKFVGRPLDASLVRRDLRHHALDLQPDLAELYARVAALGHEGPRTTSQEPRPRT